MKVTNLSGPPLHGGGWIGEETTAAIRGELEREEDGDEVWGRDRRLPLWSESDVWAREEELVVVEQKSGGVSGRAGVARGSG